MFQNSLARWETSVVEVANGDPARVGTAGRSPAGITSPGWFEPFEPSVPASAETPWLPPQAEISAPTTTGKTRHLSLAISKGPGDSGSSHQDLQDPASTAARIDARAVLRRDTLQRCVQPSIRSRAW